MEAQESLKSTPYDHSPWKSAEFQNFLLTTDSSFIPLLLKSWAPSFYHLPYCPPFMKIWVFLCQTHFIWQNLFYELIMSIQEMQDAFIDDTFA